jgi:hypothetical protein
MPHPFRGNPFAPVECDGCPVREAAALAAPQTVTTGYFRTMDIELLQGRVFDDRDDATSLPVAIVSRALAASLWGTDDVLGKRVRPVTADGAAPWLTVVGVTSDVRKTYSDSLFPDLYRPFAQDPRAYFALMVRAAGPLGVERGVRDAVSAEDPTLALADVEPMAVVVAARRGQTGMLAGFVGGVATVALGLTIAGLYAVVSYLVRTRRRELAVRLALGARTSGIVGAVLAEARSMIVAGLVLGVALALAGGRLSRAWLMELSPHDPTTVAGVVAAVLLVACLALTVPARQAAATDPANVLREE